MDYFFIFPVDEMTTISTSSAYAEGGTAAGVICHVWLGSLALQATICSFFQIIDNYAVGPGVVE